MAVQETFILPAQPAIGRAMYIPLGGNGFTAPHAAYHIVGAGIDCDVSGGSASVICQLDDRFVSLVSFWMFQSESAAADVDFRFTLAGGLSPIDVNQGTAAAVDADAGNGFRASASWIPPTVLMPGGAVGSPSNRLTCHIPNVDGTKLACSGMIYCFNIRAREVIPMNVLLSGRGSN